MNSDKKNNTSGKNNQAKSMLEIFELLPWTWLDRILSTEMNISTFNRWIAFVPIHSGCIGWKSRNMLSKTISNIPRTAVSQSEFREEKNANRTKPKKLVLVNAKLLTSSLDIPLHRTWLSDHWSYNNFVARSPVNIHQCRSQPWGYIDNNVRDDKSASLIFRRNRILRAYKCLSRLDKP